MLTQKPPTRGAAKKTAARKKIKKKPKLACAVCGMEITIDKACNCEESHPIMCCGRAMKEK